MHIPKPWYRDSKDSWFVEVNGKQHRLGKHPEGAPAPRKGKTGWNPPEEILKVFHELMAREDPASLPKPARLTVAELFNIFLTNICPYTEAPERPKVRREKGLPAPTLKENCSTTEKSYWWYRDYLSDFAKTFGKVLAKDTTPLHVDRWLKSHPKWKASARCAVTAIKRAFSWADEMGVLRPNPVKSVKKPPATARNRVLSSAERREILEAIPDAEFREFVEAMQESGARPSEIARLETKDVNLDIGICVLTKHKTGAKTSKPRIIYMTDRFREIVAPLLAKNPEGAIFRGPRFNKPFGQQGICSRFRRLREKLPHLKDAIAYAYRASFTTDALVAGVGVAQVAELLGHTSTDQVMRHYSLIRENTDYMRKMAEQATAEEGETDGVEKGKWE